MEVLKEGLVTGILLAGLVNSLYGLPFVGAYTLGGGRSALYWTLLFLLGNFSAYFFILLLCLYPGGDVLGLLGELKPLSSFLISVLSLLFAFLILLAVLTLNKHLLYIMEDIILTGGVIYLFGFLTGLYLGKNAAGMGIYLGELTASKPMFTLASFLFAIGSFVSPLYIVAGFFKVFPRHAETVGEMRFWAFTASLLLFITGLCFFF